MTPVYLDTARPDGERVQDLVARMTLEEKLSQICFAAPAIPRLGIPAYNWWNEALHGVARAGAATVFPQSIALAATFDMELVQKIGDITSTEGRAKYNAARAEGDSGLYKGLTFWAPNINIFRDPRWGRGHETYGEDPYLTGSIGMAYIKGIQGNGPRLKAAACVKHFAAHSGPEQGRHSFNAVVSEQDLAETYFPAFRRCVQEGHVEGVMGGYNCINGEPACGSRALINDLLREEWGFDGYYVSDCGAIKDFHKGHKITASVEESAALALTSGCDLNCGQVYPHMCQALAMGLVTEEDVDAAVAHLMMTRMRLGMFDKDCPFDAIPYEENDTPAHHAVALTAAEESMVLLKNDGILPLNAKSCKTIAVIGPNADTVEILKGNYNGTATEHYTLLDGIRAVAKAENPELRLMVSEGCHLWRENVEALAEADDRRSEAMAMARRADVVILCVGLNGTLEGEEGDANNSYAGADKADLLLPLPQRRLIREVAAVGTPIVLVNATGSAMALGEEAELCNAVLQVWYPGQMGGLAAAEVLFDKINPSGKLPVTFYRTTEELPPFTEYAMQGRTYRFMQNEPLYPFGYGLSYTRFAYTGLTAVPAPDGSCTVRATVTNVGTRKGSDVAQVYLRLIGAAGRVPRCSLAAFRRVTLEPGQSTELHFTLPKTAFAEYDTQGREVYTAVEAEISLGGGQPDARTAALTGMVVPTTTVKWGGWQ